MNKPRGRTIPLSLPRRWIGDLVHFAGKVPTVAVERILHIPSLMAARSQNPSPPGWSPLITKSFGIVSSRLPELRRSHLSFPTHRLYEHPVSCAVQVINRPFQGEPAVFLEVIQAPENLPLTDLTAKLSRFKNAPVEECGGYRRLLRTSKLPSLIRRPLWWFGLSVSGNLKSTHFGTFAVNSVATLGVSMTQFLTPITTTLYYGFPNSEGDMKIQMAFDHRVFDASTAALALEKLEGVLNKEMLAELSVN